MSMIGKKWKLPSIVMSKSFHDDNWDNAKLEWYLVDVDDREDDICQCGHPHIKKCATIYDPYSNKYLQPIGSECIKKFGVESLVKSMELNLGLMELSNVKDISEVANRDVLLVLDTIVNRGGIRKEAADEFKELARKRKPTNDDLYKMEDTRMSAWIWCQDKRGSLFVPSEGNFRELVHNNSRIGDCFTSSEIDARVQSAIERLQGLKHQK
jgi:hypothetical protein